MKKILYATQLILITLASHSMNGQIAIGKTTLTNSSILLEFGSEPKGIILPQVNAPTLAAGGTFIFDAADKSVKVKEEKNNTFENWTNLTQNSVQGKLHSFSNAGVDFSGNNGVIIGKDSSLKPGVLVLESTTKALVLPKVSNPQTSMKGSIAGTIVYDTDSGMLAVYDGSTWSYWK